MEWDNWPKPWSREQCKTRYVQGDRISLRGMARASGRSKSSMERWSDEDTWEDDRSQYQTSVKTATREKTIEKTSDKLSDELSDIISENYKVHKIFRDCARAYAQIRARQLADIQRMTLDEQKEELKKLNVKEMNDWSMIASRATQGISDAMGLPYWANLNTAFKKVEDSGLIVIDPTQVDKTEEE